MKRAKLPLAPWFVCAIILTFVGAFILVKAASLYFGSFPAMQDYLSGERLLVDSKSKTFGIVDQGIDQTVAFSLKNWTGRKIRVLGASSSCSCTMATNLPLEIGPDETELFKVVVHTTNISGNLTVFIRVFSDDSISPELILSVNGDIRKGSLDKHKNDDTNL